MVVQLVVAYNSRGHDVSDVRATLLKKKIKSNYEKQFAYCIVSES